jgi:YesN/AraC family two-component response regulator
MVIGVYFSQKEIKSREPRPSFQSILSDAENVRHRQALHDSDTEILSMNGILARESQVSGIDRLYLYQIDDRLNKIEKHLAELCKESKRENHHLAIGSETDREKAFSERYQTQLDQITRMTERGLSLEDISKKLRMNKGEVLLLLNLSKKS